ncbi:M23 family metallopeptidase [Cyclobacterium amurskyense]|uniref:M23 family metallopeptidase n=1 Tax=Cyclobacterium amurskyense TaxID=320787 RepID=UPI0030DD4521
MKLNKGLYTLLFVCIALVFLSQTQKGYYLFPIKPGQQNFLAGNMSEIRSNHFHTGLDIKTEGRQGLAVLASADGYVSKIKVSSFGYGNVLYLKHTNGTSTVYAHLRSFESPIAEFMQHKIYEARENELEYTLNPGELPISQGDTIAYSGNTGSSGGPHLHFEIRDSLNRAIDPLHAGFKEIVDTTSPIVRRVAISPLTPDSRVNGMYRRQEFSLIYSSGAFQVQPTIKISGKVGIEVLAYDQLDEMYNRNGFPIFEIYEADKKIFRAEVNEIDFNIGRHILLHTYRNRYTRLYKKPNNKFSFYEPDTVLSGAISAMPGEEKSITVKLLDAYANESDLRIQFSGELAPTDLEGINYTSGNSQIDYQENVLILNSAAAEEGDLAIVHVNGLSMELPYAYTGRNKRTYLWDMRLGVPDSIDLCSETILPEVEARIPAGEELLFDNGEVRINFEKESLLDDLYLRIGHFEEKGLKGLTINDQFDYLWQQVSVRMKVDNFQGDTSKTHMYQLYRNGHKNFVGGNWQVPFINFKTRVFGDFVLATDSIPPSIRAVRVNSREIRFVIKDNLSGIKDFNAWVDGKWTQMRYEHKQAIIWSDPLPGTTLKGEVLLKVRDRANNEAIYKGNI